MKNLIAAIVITPFLLAACQPASETTETGAPPEAAGPVLSYTDAFIIAPIADRDVTMGGIEITVNGGDVQLSGASSDIASSIETHSMTMEDNVMKMRKTDGFYIEDGETLDLDRGANHLMLFGVKPGLAAGDTVDITFYFDVEGRDEPLRLDARAEVRAVGE